MLGFKKKKKKGKLGLICVFSLMGFLSACHLSIQLLDSHGNYFVLYWDSLKNQA